MQNMNMYAVDSFFGNDDKMIKKRHESYWWRIASFWCDWIEDPFIFILKKFITGLKFISICLFVLSVWCILRFYKWLFDNRFRILQMFVKFFFYFILPLFVLVLLQQFRLFF